MYGMQLGMHGRVYMLVHLWAAGHTEAWPGSRYMRTHAFQAEMGSCTFSDK